MNPVPVVFHPDYVPGTTDHFNRLAAVARHAIACGAGRLAVPEPIPVSALDGLHDARYLDAYLNGTEPLASSSGIRWSPATRRSTLLMLGGQSLAVSLAMSGGVAFNLACGFHHAHPAYGGGFCAINGLAYVAHAFPGLKVAVLDCDEHGGDGTEAFCRIIPNLHQATVFGSRFGVRGGVRSLAVKIPKSEERESEQIYIDAVDDALRHLFDLAPDILLYQAGMDPHVSDPKSTLRLSTETLTRRDRWVIRACLRVGIPLVVILAGAYQKIEDIVRLYGNTLQEAWIAVNETTVRASPGSLAISS